MQDIYMWKNYVQNIIVVYIYKKSMKFCPNIWYNFDAYRDWLWSVNFWNLKTSFRRNEDEVFVFKPGKHHIIDSAHVQGWYWVYEQFREEYQVAITMEDPDEQNPNDNIQPSISTQLPTTCSSATYSDQPFSYKSSRNTKPSSPKMTEKQNNHQASYLWDIWGIFIAFTTW